MQLFLVKHQLIEVLGRTFFFRIYDAEAKQYPGGMRDNFEIPNAEDNIRGYKGKNVHIDYLKKMVLLLQNLQLKVEIF